MPSETLEIGGCATLESQDRSQFLAHMTEGLHALAQPLTILRSSVPALAAVDISPAKQQRYLELSVRQVHRACSLFECLQDLMIAGQTQADCAPINLSTMVAAVAEDQQEALLELGVELRVLLPVDLPTALGDDTRTRQVLSAGLSVAALVSTAGDVIQVTATTRHQCVELIFEKDRDHGIPLESHERLNLRLAQTNMLSQQGEYECSEAPFKVRLAWPCLPAVP
jgi:light-regulated signal transduction histidine kinase (bacteriophytochrome)